MQRLTVGTARTCIAKQSLCGSVFTRSLATSTTTPLSETLAEVDEAPTGMKIGGRKRTIRVAERIASLMEKAVEQDEAHFRVGGQKSYFPRDLITLLPPIAKHTPYQARFRVPRTFNKLDLRDYLYHIYGLRAYNITVQLTRPVFLPQPDGRRLTTTQKKIMTIDMDEPFIWPTKEFDEHEKDMLAEEAVHKEAELFIQRQAFRKGSDHFKPIEGLFNGVGGPTEPIPQPFVSALSYRQLKNEKLNSTRLSNEKQKLNTIEELINKEL